MTESNAFAAMQAENARLIALLETYGIEWRLPTPPIPEVRDLEPSKLSTAEKVALFSRLFCGRTDVYPIRWENQKTGRSGYTPACGNDWEVDICLKKESPPGKCSDCSNRLLIPLTDAVIYPKKSSWLVKLRPVERIARWADRRSGA